MHGTAMSSAEEAVLANAAMGALVFVDARIQMTTGVQARESATEPRVVGCMVALEFKRQGRDASPRQTR
jgi:hypothetical protein